MGGPDKPGHDELFGGSGEKGATASPSLRSMAAILPAGPDVSRTREARRRAAGPRPVLDTPGPAGSHHPWGLRAGGIPMGEKTPPKLEIEREWPYPTTNR